MLSEVLFWERTQIGTSQRGLARMIGFTQQKLSASETGRVTPSWRTFVRLLASMDLRPVLETELMPRPGRGLDDPKELLRVIDTAVNVIGDRRYRIAGVTASQVCGGERADVVQLLVEGDPDRLDDLAIAADAAHGNATTRRGFRSTTWGYVVQLYVVPELPPAVEIIYHGATLTLARD